MSKQLLTLVLADILALETLNSLVATNGYIKIHVNVASTKTAFIMAVATMTFKANFSQRQKHLGIFCSK